MSTPAPLPVAVRQEKWNALWRVLLMSPPPDPPPNKKTTGGEPVAQKGAR